MDNNLTLADVICNIFDRTKGLDQQAQDLGELIAKIKRNENTFGEGTQISDELERLAALQEKIVLKMLNEVSEQDIPSKPHLKVVK